MKGITLIKEDASALINLGHLALAHVALAIGTLTGLLVNFA